MGAAKKVGSYLRLLWRERLPDSSEIPDVIYEEAEKSSLAREHGVKIATIGPSTAPALFGEGFRSPILEVNREFVVESAAERMLFSRLLELYRVLELLARTVPTLVETYSKFRERRQFEETIKLRHFDWSPLEIAQLDPSFSGQVLAIHNHLLELALYLRFTDALPSHVEKNIRDSLEILLNDWNFLVDRVEAEYRWSFKKLG